MKTNKSQRKKFIFTLLELLIVVSIIMILAGILLPALVKAKESSRQISCASNERQIGLAYIAYAGDFDSWILPNSTSYPNNWNGAISVRPWHELLAQLPKAPYRTPLNYGAGIGSRGNFNGKREDGSLNRYYTYGAALYCPSNYEYAVYYGDYASNRWLCGDPFGPYADIYEEHKIMKVKSPSTAILALENRYPVHFTIDYLIQSGEYRAAFRHNGRINVLYADGHVQLKSKTDMYCDISPYSKVLKIGF